MNPVEVYVSECHPFYWVWVDGKIYDEMTVRNGIPLTWSQQWDIANGYREGLTV